MMQKHTSLSYDWSVRTALEISEKRGCKFVLSKKLIRLAVLRNRIKRVIRSFSKKQYCCFFRIKIRITKKNCELIIDQIKNSLRPLVLAHETKVFNEGF